MIMNIIFSIVLLAIISIIFYFIKETKRLDKNLNDTRDIIVEIIGEINNLSKTYDSDFSTLKDDQTNDVQSKDIFDLKNSVFSMHREFAQLAIQVDGLKQTVDRVPEIIKMILGDSDSD